MQEIPTITWKELLKQHPILFVDGKFRFAAHDPLVDAEPMELAFGTKRAAILYRRQWLIAISEA